MAQDEMKQMLLKMIEKALSLEQTDPGFFDEVNELKEKCEEAQLHNVSENWDIDGLSPIAPNAPMNTAQDDNRDWTIVEEGHEDQDNDSVYSSASFVDSFVSRTSAGEFDGRKAFLDDTHQAPPIHKIKPFVLPSIYSFVASEPAIFKDPIVVPPETNPLRIVSTAKNKLLPTIAGTVLLGDNLFLDMAITTMDFVLNLAYKRPISGMCMSGLSIRMAVRELHQKNFAEGTILVANLGTTDLLLGREVTHMIEEYMKLLQVCDSKKYILIATTMAPIAEANYNHDHFKQFNAFLKKMPYCIDLFANMVDENKMMKQKYYRDVPKNIDGAPAPIILWSDKGHYRVLTTIERNLCYFASID